MDHLTLRLADMTILAHSVTELDENGHHKGSHWDVLVSDELTGERELATWTNEQFNAVVVLTIAGEEDIIFPVRDALYAIAEPLLAGWKSNVRPIP